MTSERWEQIRQLVQSSFTVSDEYSEDLDPGTAQVIEFEAPAGLLQLRFITRPKSLGTKTNYTHRAGADIAVTHVYSDSEQVSHLEALKWNEAADDWEPFVADGLFPG